MNQLKYLFQKAQIGKVELRNRIVMPSMGVIVGEEFASDRLIDLYVERSKGGAGLIIISGTTIQALQKSGGLLSISDDRYIPSFRKLVDSVHEYGAKIGIQIIHLGKYAYPTCGVESVSASPVFSNFTQQMPRELTIPEIKECVRNFTKAVNRAKQAGFDVVEFNCSTGYLIREFLSPVSNKRTDEYGGDLNNRMRFLLEIIKSVKMEVGDDYPLGFRISADEFTPGGNTLKETVVLAKELERAGADVISVAPGGNDSTVPMVPDLVPLGAFTYLSQAIKEGVGIPVIASGRINDPFLADDILRDRKADLIAIGRGLLADPEFPNKAAEGRFDDIRKCIGCVQGCFDMLWPAIFGQESRVTCLVNPGLGREREFEILPAPKKKRVMVIGGGPAGMEAARVLAIRGHKVSLYERQDKLGGQLNLASIPPGKWEFDNITRYLSRELQKSGVDIFVEKEVTPEFVGNEKPDAVIVATGAIPIIPSIPGVDQENVVTANQVLAADIEVGQKVVVVGGGGIGCETALFLAERGAMDAETALFLTTWGALDADRALALTKKGKEVTIVEMLPSIGRDIGITRRGFTRRLLGMLGVDVITSAEVKGIIPSGVELIKNGERQTIAADTVVIAVGTYKDDKLYQKLKGKVPELFVIGDSKEARKALDAIHEGSSIAREI